MIFTSIIQIVSELFFVVMLILMQDHILYCNHKEEIIVNIERITLLPQILFECVLLHY
jgi:hypothetical protein